jgi:tetratricopeptide (TPR) repeat protein
MRHMRNHASRGCTFAAALPLILAVAFPLPAAVAGEQTEDARWYRSCMELADNDPEKALNLAEARGKETKGTPAGHCAAVAVVRLSRYEEAAMRFEALAGEVERADLRAALFDQAAGAWLLQGSAERAVALMASAIEIAPDDANLRIDRAMGEAALGRYKDAIADLNHALAVEPGMIDAYVFRASAWRRLDAPERAAADLDRALALDPNHPEGLLERGILRQLRGDRAGAREDWEAVLRVAPGSKAAEAALADLASLAGK